MLKAKLHYFPTVWKLETCVCSHSWAIKFSLQNYSKYFYERNRKNLKAEKNMLILELDYTQGILSGIDREG